MKLEWWIKCDKEGNILERYKVSLPKEKFRPEGFNIWLTSEDISLIQSGVLNDFKWSVKENKVVRKDA